MNLIQRVFYKIGSLFIDYERVGNYAGGAVERSRIRQITDLERQVQTLSTRLVHIAQHLDLPQPSFEEIQFRVFSQNGEDGILHHLFDHIGVKHKRAVEICAGNGQENNTANLVVHFGWSALLFDGHDGNVAEGQRFYRMNPATALFPPKFVHAWITPENVDELIRANGFEGEIDLLSIDLDGQDYWIWESVKCVNPRVVVIEYNQVWPEDKAVTVPKNPAFQAEFSGGFADYCGASLAALVSLGRKLGYRLVGVEAKQFNAFFVRNDIAPDIFPEMPVGKGLDSEFVVQTRAERLPKIQGKEWVEIDTAPLKRHP